MAKYKAIFDRNNCIGAIGCNIYPKRWKYVEEDHKSTIINGNRLNDGTMELEFDEDELQNMIEAAKACPVAVIKIINLETNEQIV